MKYIIMCGGAYEKFKIPKQLLKVNGEVLVERTIRLLKENGIKDIAVSTNNPAFDYLDVEILQDKDNQFVYFGKDENKESKNSWLRAYYPINKPVCYLHGDVYFSDEAIKTIINTKVKDTMFFCCADKWDIPNKDIRNAGGREPLAYKVENYKLFRKAINELLQMIDDGKFKNAKIPPLAWTVYKYLNGLELSYNAEWFGDWNNIFDSKGDYIIINDYTNDVDDIKDVAKIEDYLKLGGDSKMIKVEVIREFTYKDFDKIEKSLIRNDINKNEKGKLFPKDTFECTDGMAKYLTGECGYVLVEVIEVIPEEAPVVENKVEEIKEEPKEEVKKPKRTRKKK